MIFCEACGCGGRWLWVCVDCRRRLCRCSRRWRTPWGVVCSACWLDERAQWRGLCECGARDVGDHTCTVLPRFDGEEMMPVEEESGG